MLPRVPRCGWDLASPAGLGGCAFTFPGPPSPPEPGFTGALFPLSFFPGLAVHQIITITVSLIMVIAALITTLVLKNW